jgi:hypothetical protein
MQYWEVIADKLHAAGWSWGYCSAVTRDGWRWIVDAHREGRRYIVHSDELLKAFLELKRTLLWSVDNRLYGIYKVTSLIVVIWHDCHHKFR